MQRYLGLILRDTRHLSRLIDDLFELSQIDSGALRLRCVPFDMAELVAETVAAYQAPAAENDVRLEEAVASSGEPTRVKGDPDLLQRVLRNLLDNALRHTPAGGTIQVQAARAGGQIQVSVSESGPGVAEVDLGRIFDRIYRGELSRRRDGGADGVEQ